MMWLMLFLFFVLSILTEPVVLGIIAISIVTGLIHPAIGVVTLCILTALLVLYIRGKNENST